MIRVPVTKKTVDRFDTLLRNYQHDFKEKISDSLPLIRAGQMEESELQDFLNKHDASAFGRQRLQKWIDQKERELEVLEQYTSLGEVIEANDLPGLLANIDLPCVVAMMITNHSQDTEPFIKQLEDPDRSTDDVQDPADSPFVTKIPEHRELVKVFRAALEKHEGDEKISLVIFEEGLEGDKEPTVALRLYENGSLISTDNLLPDPVQSVEVGICWVQDSKYIPGIKLRSPSLCMLCILLYRNISDGMFKSTSASRDIILNSFDSFMICNQLPHLEVYLFLCYLLPCRYDIEIYVTPNHLPIVHLHTYKQFTLTRTPFCSCRLTRG